MSNLILQGKSSSKSAQQSRAMTPPRQRSPVSSPHSYSSFVSKMFHSPRSLSAAAGSPRLPAAVSLGGRALPQQDHEMPNDGMHMPQTSTALDSVGQVPLERCTDVSLARKSMDLQKIRTRSSKASKEEHAACSSNFSFTPAETNSKVMSELVLAQMESSKQSAKEEVVRGVGEVMTGAAWSADDLNIAALSGTELVQMVIEELEHEANQTAVSTAVAGTDDQSLPLPMQIPQKP
jgi:hypothetical protein